MAEATNHRSLQWAKKETVRQHYTDLLDTVDAKGVAPYLYQKKVITEPQMESITHEKTQQAGASSLLRQLSRSDNPDAMPIFIDALHQNNCTHISKQLAATYSDQLSGRNSELFEENLSETLLKQPYQTSSQVHLNEVLSGAFSETLQDSREVNRASADEQTEVKRLSGGSSVSFGFHVSDAELVNMQSNRASQSLDEVDGGSSQTPFHEQDSKQKRQLITKTVTLTKKNGSYGFKIMEGNFRPRHTGDEDIYITHVFPELEEENDEVQVNDTIISVNDENIHGLSKAKVRELITAKSTVCLELCSYEARR